MIFRAYNVCKMLMGAALLVGGVAGCATIPADLPPVPVTGAGRNDGMTNSRMTNAPAISAPIRRSSFPPVVIPDPPRAAGLDEEILRLQVLLDRANFSPGCLDGRLGSQTRAALRAWQQREGMAASGELDEPVRARLPAGEDAFTVHTVTAEEHAALRAFPRDWRARAALDHHGYATIREAVAERFHLTERAMAELNPGPAWPNPPAGTVLRVPRVRPAERVTAARLEIHLRTKLLQVYDAGDRLVGQFPCSIARNVEKRPVGALRIVNAAENPNYTFNPELFAEDPVAASIGRRLLIPPGPNNPVGVAWLSLDRPGYGIHGTPAPEDIGKTESHGCFRLANWNARKVLGMVSIDMPVHVHE